MSPLRTLLNTRDARGANAVEQLRTAISILQENTHLAEMIEFELKEEHVPLTLGWLLSNKARHGMQRQLGRPTACSTVTDIQNECSWGKSSPS